MLIIFTKAKNKKINNWISSQLTKIKTIVNISNLHISKLIHWRILVFQVKTFNNNIICSKFKHKSRNNNNNYCYSNNKNKILIKIKIWLQIRTKINHIFIYNNFIKMKINQEMFHLALINNISRICKVLDVLIMIISLNSWYFYKIWLKINK